jgi:hypothetical protein
VDLIASIIIHSKLQSLEPVYSTALVVHLHQLQLLQQLLLSTGSSLFSLGPTGPTLLPGTTKRLGWLGSCTPTRTAFSELELDLPLNCPLTLELLLNVLLNCFLLFSRTRSPGFWVLAWTVRKLPIVAAEV